ncbi:MAG: SPOR domain-containing protein [Fibrobacter sp.]|nr:SPOR domain-containing protein [Fibrobacter sp.]
MYSNKIKFAAILLAFVMAGANTTDLDTLLQGKEYKLPALKASMRAKEEPVSTSETKSKSSNSEFTLQFDALADFDAAQNRRADLQRRTGIGIRLIFDSPFYKLRGGSFSTKDEADDQVRALQEYNIQAFVIKIK